MTSQITFRPGFSAKSTMIVFDLKAIPAIAIYAFIYSHTRCHIKHDSSSPSQYNASLERQSSIITYLPIMWQSYQIYANSATTLISRKQQELPPKLQKEAQLPVRCRLIQERKQGTRPHRSILIMSPLQKAKYPTHHPWLILQIPRAIRRIDSVLFFHLRRIE